MFRNFKKCYDDEDDDDDDDDDDDVDDSNEEKEMNVNMKILIVITIGENTLHKKMSFILTNYFEVKNTLRICKTFIMTCSLKILI